MRKVLLFGGLLILVTSCQNESLKTLTDALNARGDSHCLAVTGSLAGYGGVRLYAKVGKDIDCDALWRRGDLLLAPTTFTPLPEHGEEGEYQR